MANLDIVVRAKDEAKKALQGIEGAAGKVTGAFKALGAVAAVGGLALGFKKLINDTVSAGDALDKMSKRVGISAKTLSEWSHVAQLGGSSIQSLEASFRRLSRNLAAAAEGNETAKKAFSDMGLSISDASGKLKTAEQLLIESADAMTLIEGEANKVSSSFNLFGIAGTAMIPILDQGSDAIREQIEEAHKLGVVMDDEAVAASVNYADAMTRLTAAITGLINMAIVPLLGPLTNIVKQFTALVSLDFKQLAIELGLVGSSINQLDKEARKMKKIGEEGRKMLHELRPDIFSKEWAKAGDETTKATKKNTENQLDLLQDIHNTQAEMAEMDAKIQEQFNKKNSKQNEEAIKKQEKLDENRLNNLIWGMQVRLAMNNALKGAEESADKAAADREKQLAEDQAERDAEIAQLKLNKFEETEIQKQQLAMRTAELEKQHAQIISSAVGGAFRQVFESGKKGADEFGKVMLRILLEVITQLIVANVLAASLGPGGKILAGAIGGIGAGLGSLFQTSPGMTKIVPGSPLQAVPIIAHGGETLSRGGGAGPLVINVQGSVFNADETLEAIRAGLHGMRTNTGRTV